MATGFDASKKNWLKAGGIFGTIILFLRLTRIPLATIITLLPFLLQYLRDGENEQKKSGGGAMTREEARLILGVSPQDDAQAVREAHRKLIQKNHPDLGGTDYLAAKINQARDVLLN